MLTCLFSNSAYIHYIRPRGPLETSIRAHLLAWAFPLIVARMYTFIVVNMSALSLLVFAIITA
jgi:hypothetical protein